MTNPHPSPLKNLVLLGLLLLALAVAGCNLPVRTPASPGPTTPTPIPGGPTQSAPSAVVTIIPIDSDSTPGPAATSSPIPSASVTPSSQAIDRRDAGAVIAGVRAALLQKDAGFFAQFAPESLTYVDYIEGGQPVDRAKLLEDLTTRFAASSPQCDQYGTYEQTLQVWTSGWSPVWQIDQICYQGCNPLNPPHTSQTAAFFFSPNSNGEYELSTVWLNDDNLWHTVYQVTMHACGEPYQPPASASSGTPGVTPTAFSCPGAPATRLKSGDRAYASDQTAIPSRVRSAPGTSSEILGLIQPRQVVEILDGPQCAQGYIWWKVHPLGSSLTGWTAEGNTISYWLEPCTVAKCGQP
jgi:hypothetical protein